MRSHLISVFVLGLLMFAHAQDYGDTSPSTTTNTTTHVVTSTTQKSTTATTKSTSTTATTKSTSTTATTKPTSTTAKPTSTTAKFISHKTNHSTMTEPSTTTHEVDTTTTAKTSTTTKMMTTTPKPTGPPRFALMKGNMTCLLLQANITVAFNFTSSAGKAQKVNNTIPRDAETTGECGDSMERLSINWVEGTLTQTLELKFTKTSSDSSLTNVTFAYMDSSSSGFISGSWSSTTSLLSTQLGTSYNCTKGVDVTVGAMKMKMDDLQVGAFMEDKSANPSFQKTGSDCAYDGKTDAIVPIAVGCALAAMVLIVLVGYCIGRRRSAANNYQSMNNA